MVRTYFQRLRHVAEALAAYAGWGLFAVLPVERASAIAGFIARAVGPRLKNSLIARQNLRLAFPDLDDAGIEAIVLQVWDNLGRTVGEFPHMRQIANDRVEIVGGEHVDAMRDDGKPGLLVGAHLGGWELSMQLAGRLGLPLGVIYRKPNNPWIDRLFRKARGGDVEGMIPKGPAGARQVLAALKAGMHLGFLVDQKMNDGIAVPFFGREVMTAPAAAHLALKFQCPVVPVHIVRLPGVRFRAIFEAPLELPDSGDRSEDTFALMCRVNERLEAWIRETPGQWLWLHHRWPKC
ncbi:MAG TPA: hypothetical protein VM661_18215 [Candidatus Sulfotelmatobacter sp.]|jgi:KDO2-lipid IV(A) lauroyltransferase|nr:hypothetical protein [Candidatus Sulfotelmatobacter sp.]